MVSGKCDKRHPTECYYFRKYGRGVNLAHSDNINRVTSNLITTKEDWKNILLSLEI